MPSWWQPLLAELQRTNFADLAGAHAAVSIPIPDQLLGPLITERLPRDGAVREIAIRAHAGNEFTVRVRLRRPALLPPLTLRLRIVEQPRLPGDAILGLLLAPSGIGAFAGPALRMLDTPGIEVDGHRIRIDLAAMAARYRIDAFRFLTRLHVTTEEGRLVVAADAAV
jgi:hypothetical protein